MTVKRQQRQGRRRRRNQDQEDDSEDEDSDPPNHPSCDTDSCGTGPKAQRSRYYACHFYKLDPDRHYECGSLKLKGPGRVRQHLKRSHSPETYYDYYCPICSKHWDGNRRGSEDQWKSHIQRGGCQRDDAEERPDYEHLTQDEVVELNDLRGPNGDHVEQWYQMWDLLFPGYERPSSPYIKRGFAEPTYVIRERNKLRSFAALEDMIRNARDSELLVEDMDGFFDLCYSTQSPGHRFRQPPDRLPAGDGATAMPIVAQPQPHRTHDNVYYNALLSTDTFPPSGPQLPPVASITGPLGPPGPPGLALAQIPTNAYYQPPHEQLITENSAPAGQYNSPYGMLTPNQCVSAPRYGDASVQQSAALVVPLQPTHSTNPMLAQGEPGHNFNYWGHFGNSLVGNFSDHLDFGSVASGQDWVQGNIFPIPQSDLVAWPAPSPVTTGTAPVTTQTTKPLEQNYPQPLGPSIP